MIDTKDARVLLDAATNMVVSELQSVAIEQYGRASALWSQASVGLPEKPAADWPATPYDQWCADVAADRLRDARKFALQAAGNFMQLRRVGENAVPAFGMPAGADRVELANCKLIATLMVASERMARRSDRGDR